MKHKSCTPVIAASMAALVALSGWAAKPFVAYASPFGIVQVVGYDTHSPDGDEVIVSGECGADSPYVIWELHECGVLVIRGTGAMADFHWDSVANGTDAPWITQGFGQSIEDVVIDSGVTNVGDYAFAGCESLVSVTVSEGVEEIGSHAFAGCAALKSVKLPDSLAQIGLSTFENCSGLKELAIPSCEIGNRAFGGCGSLSALYFDGVSGSNQGQGGDEQNGIHPFDGVTATAYYRGSDPWADGEREGLGDSANLTWVALDDGEFNGRVGEIEANVFADDGTSSNSNPSPSEAQQSGSWQKNDIGWWWSYPDGKYPTSGWEYINRNWYYFNSSGYMMTGWQFLDGHWYYFGGVDDGAMKTGWQQVGSTWYYMDASGVMQTGWQQMNGRWYYMHEDGAMQTGWLQLGDTWYYLYDNGAMAADAWIGNDYVDASGVWVSDASVDANVIDFETGRK